MPQSKEIRIGVYRASKSGLSLILKDLTTFLKKGGSLSFLIGYCTDPDFLDEIQKLEEVKPIKIGLYGESIFHSKVYIFKLKDNSTRMILGSSNLTSSAFSTNVEANAEIEGFRDPERRYDDLFEESERNRKTIRKTLSKLSGFNKQISKSEKNLEKKARQTLESKYATWLWNELDGQIEKVLDDYLRDRLRIIWLGGERRIVSDFHVKKTRNGKKAWLRRRLSYAMSSIILNTERRLTVPEKIRIFKGVTEYTLRDSEITKEHFSKKPLQSFVSLIKRKQLEASFRRALWSRQKYGRRLFAKLSYWAI